MKQKGPLSQLHILQSYYRATVERDAMRSQLIDLRDELRRRDQADARFRRFLGFVLCHDSERFTMLPESMLNDEIQAAVKALRSEVRQ